MKKQHKSLLILIGISGLFVGFLVAALWASTTLPAATLPMPEVREESMSTPVEHQEPLFQTLTAEEAYVHLFLEDGTHILLDVRTEEEYQGGHIYGALLIPLAELQARAPAELPDKDVPIFVYCRSGRRSQEAAALLTALGYRHVINIAGGIESWPFETVTAE